MVPIPRHVRRNHVAAILVIAFGVSFVANAQTPAPAAPATVTADETKKPPKPFHGSSISYGHSITAMTVYGRGEAFNAGTVENPTQTQAAYYDPTWSHTLGLAPEWHFNDLLFTRARFFISQEFTPSGTTSRKNEVELSDIFLDVGTTGYKEKVTGLKVAGDVRFILPTSKATRAKTQWFTVGPAVSLTRRFDVLSGLTVGYAARGTIRFNQYTSPIKQDYSNTSCLGQGAGAGCQQDLNLGGRNGFFDFAHGPLVSFQPIEAVSIDTSMTWARVWLYKPADTTLETSPQDLGPNVRDISRFVLSVNWQFSKPVGVALTALTVGNQLGDDGRYTFPLFNRSTVLSLDATVDIEAVASKLF